MIIQNEIAEKKAVRFSELDGGDIFSFEYPPENIYMKLSTDQILYESAEGRVLAVLITSGYCESEISDNDFTYPLTGKLIITG